MFYFSQSEFSELKKVGISICYHKTNNIINLKRLPGNIMCIELQRLWNDKMLLLELYSFLSVIRSTKIVSNS